MQDQPQLNIDLKNTQAITNSDGKNVFVQGVLLRKVSKFVTGTNEDALMPIPIFFDPSTGKIVESSVPKELREEMKDELI